MHVVYRNEEENIHEDQIASQMKALNQDFRARNRDVDLVPDAFKDRIGDAHIEFSLADVDPFGSPTGGVTRTHSVVEIFDESEKVKTSGEWRRGFQVTRYLNIWVCTLGGGLLGSAQSFNGPPQFDGIVIDHRAFGTVGTAVSPFNMGRTATREIGRYLGLLNIWGATTGCTSSDLVADTPNQFGPNFGSPTFPHITCGNDRTGICS